MGKLYIGGRLRSTDTFAVTGSRTLSGATPEDIWEGSGTSRDIPSAAAQVDVISTSADDAAAGTGCQTVRLDYLDSNGDRQSETITLNGLTAVQSTATDIAQVLGLTGMTFGSGNTAAGDITVEDLGNTEVHEFMGSFDSASSTAAYAVPAANKAYVNKASASASTATCRVSLYSDTNPKSGAVVSGAMYVWDDWIANSGDRNPSVPIGPFPASAKIWLVAKDAASTTVVGTIEGYLEPA